MNTKLKIAGTALATFALTVTGMGLLTTERPNNGQSETNNTPTVTVGLVGSSDKELWDTVAKTAKDKYGITIKTKTFTDYNQPNKAVAEGSIDLNAFQHNDFLKNWNASNNNELVAIGNTNISPLRLYANSLKSVDEFKTGDTIVVPNDPTNEARALELLENAKLIGLKKTTMPTVKDITSNPKELKIKAVAADQTATNFKSGNVNGAVINSNYALEAKVNVDSAIYVEPLTKNSTPWINIIAAKKDQKDNKNYANVVKAYQTETTKEYFKKHWGDAQISAWDLDLK